MRRLRSLGVLMAALALMLRVTFGAGVMLAPAASALPTLVICTGQGAMTVQVDAEGKAHAADPSKPKPQSADTHPCAFAGAAVGLAAPLPLLAPVSLAAIALPMGRPSPDQRPGRGLAAPPPPSTGPPASID